jgi:hypothetical protein
MIDQFAALAASEPNFIARFLENLLYDPWQGEWFKKEIWDGFTKFVRVTLTVAGALFLIYEIRARRLREKIPLRWKTRVSSAPPSSGGSSRGTRRGRARTIGTRWWPLI